MRKMCALDRRACFGDAAAAARPAESPQAGIKTASSNDFLEVVLEGVRTPAKKGICNYA